MKTCLTRVTHAAPPAPAYLFKFRIDLPSLMEMEDQAKHLDGGELLVKEQFLVKVEGTQKSVKVENCEESIVKSDVKVENCEESIANPNVDSGGDAQEKEEKANGKSSAKGKSKGRNKNRPPPMKFARHERVCPILVDVAADEDAPQCSYPNCSFQHDLKEYLEKKPPDIGDTCYAFAEFGRCPRGVTCRFGKAHIKLIDGDALGARNKVDAEKWNKWKDVKRECNHLSGKLKHSLRKKEIDFKECDRLVDHLFKAREEESKATSAAAGEAEAKKLRIEDPVVSVYNDRDKKKIDWSDKLYLAPLTTVGNLPFRRLCKKLGADITCGEMSVGLQLLQGHQPEWALVQRHHTEDLFGIQVCGGSPQQMARLARVIEDHVDCDFVDINCGCPIDLIYKRGMGCGLMGRKKPLEILCRSMSSILSVPLTVKIRTGIYMDKRIAHSVVQPLREWGVDMVTLHGRSREQRYYRLADWDYIGECAKLADPLPLYGNGDLMNFEDVYSRKTSSGAAGVMFARGALIKPWVFTEVKERRHWDISASERLDLIRDYVNYGLEHWGSDSKGVETTRRFLLEWLSFLHRYVPVGLLKHPPQRMNQRIPKYVGRDEVETLLGSPSCADWIKISEMFLGKVPEGFAFEPKHKAHGYK